MSDKGKYINKSLTYVKSVYLSGYKSIYEAKVSLEPGLNIIIGKNGSGKSNFIKFLNNSLNFDFSNLGRGASKLSLINYLQEEIEISTQEQKISKNKNIHFINNSKTSIIREGNKVLIISDSEKELLDKLDKKHASYVNILIKHGLPSNLELISKPLNLSTYGNLKLKVGDENLPYFIRCYLFDLFSTLPSKNIFINDKYRDKSNKEEWVKEIIITLFNNIIEPIKPYLSNFTPITDLRLNNFNIVLEKENDDCLINNLFIEFQVDNKWYVFDNLSDGTQRLFYIISELAISATHHFSKSSYSKRFDGYSKIVFLEEPELGVHPHQLFKLMQFIKEQSNKMQIIITTHAPKSLDILSEKELDRILICSMTKKGTQLKKLSASQKKHGINYIKTTGFLSDYWFHSDLEP